MWSPYDGSTPYVGTTGVVAGNPRLITSDPVAVGVGGTAETVFDFHIVGSPAELNGTSMWSEPAMRPPGTSRQGQEPRRTVR